MKLLATPYPEGIPIEDVTPKTEQEKKLQEEVLKLRTLLVEVGICPDCKEIIGFDVEDGPFAYCACGCCECHIVPLLSQVWNKEIEEIWKKKQSKSS